MEEAKKNGGKIVKISFVIDDDENILFNDSKDSQRPKQRQENKKKAQF